MSSLNSALVSKNLPRPQSSFRPQDFHSQLELSPSPRTTLILTEISLVTSGFLVLVAQSYQTLCDHMDCNRPGSSVHGILRPRILEWVAMSSSRRSSWPRIESGSPALQAHSLLSEPPGKPKVLKDHVCFPFCTCWMALSKWNNHSGQWTHSLQVLRVSSTLSTLCYTSFNPHAKSKRYTYFPSSQKATGLLCVMCSPPGPLLQDVGVSVCL